MTHTNQDSTVAPTTKTARPRLGIDRVIEIAILAVVATTLFGLFSFARHHDAVAYVRTPSMVHVTNISPADTVPQNIGGETLICKTPQQCTDGLPLPFCPTRVDSATGDRVVASGAGGPCLSPIDLLECRVSERGSSPLCHDALSELHGWSAFASPIAFVEQLPWRVGILLVLAAVWIVRRFVTRTARAPR